MDESMSLLNSISWFDSRYGYHFEGNMKKYFLKKIDDYKKKRQAKLERKKFIQSACKENCILFTCQSYKFLYPPIDFVHNYRYRYNIVECEYPDMKFGKCSESLNEVIVDGVCKSYLPKSRLDKLENDSKHYHHLKWQQRVKSDDDKKLEIIKEYFKLKEGEIKCPKCNGTGKVDWVENVIGKTRDIEL